MQMVLHLSPDQLLHISLSLSRVSTMQKAFAEQAEAKEVTMSLQKQEN